MSWHMIVTLTMLVLVTVLMFKNVSSPGVIFSTIPILACLIMGFTPGEIHTFIGDGVKSVSGTLFLMVFAVLYFGILHEAGVFQALIKLVMRFLGNSVLGSMWIAAIVAMLTQLDGSGATTALCTIPAMRPIFEKQRIRMEALLLIESLASGILCLLPWAPGLLEASAYVGVDVYEVFRFLVPVLIFSLLALMILCIPLSVLEKRRGAGMSQEEFRVMREEINKPLEFPLGKAAAIFDGVLTFFLVGGLLSGKFKTNFAFGAAFGIIFLVNYRKREDQKAYFKRQSGLALEMAFTMLGVGVLVGINQGTGALKELAELITSQTSAGFIAHLPVLLCILSMPLSITLGGSKNSVILPTLIPMAAAVGFTPVQVLGTVFATGVISANLSLFNASPYLALGLANVEMKDHLSYSLLPVYGFSILMTIFMVVSGMLPL